MHVLKSAWGRVDGHWRHVIAAAFIGVLGSLMVAGFRQALMALESLLVGARGGHLVAAAAHLPLAWRVSAPALGALAAGTLLWWAQRWQVAVRAPAHGGDYIEAVRIGDGRLDLSGGAVKVAASLLVVGSGNAVGREGAMVLLAAMLASLFGRVFGASLSLRLLVSCGAAAGLAAAYNAPLAAALFVAEILLGSMAASQLGPVIVAAVTAHGVNMVLGERAVLFPMALTLAPGWQASVLVVGLGVTGGVMGAGVLRVLAASRRVFEMLSWPKPLTFAVAGLFVGLLSWCCPEVWGNGYSSIAQLLAAPGAWQAIALVLLLKILATCASAGSGAPGGVFTPTLFIGASLGAMTATGMAALGLELQAPAALYVIAGMAVLLAATTHAPVMAALMLCELTGRYDLLPLLMPASVAATLVSTRMQPTSDYGLGQAQPAPGPAGRP